MRGNSERYKRLVAEAKQELKDIGINIRDDIQYLSNSKSKHTLGFYNNKTNTITISKILFNFDDITIKDTIIHEMLHSIPRNKRTWFGMAILCKES